MKFEIKEEIIDKIVDGVECEETTVYRVFEDGTKEVACTFCKPKETEPVTPQPTQLDRIEYAINKTQSEIAQEAIDNYTLELIEGGVIA